MQKEMEILWAKKLPLAKDPVILYALCESKMLFKEALNQDNTVQAYLERLEEIPGFDEFFVANGGCVSKQQVVDKFSKECAEWVFTMPECSTQTALFIKDEYLLGREFAPSYRIAVPGFGETYFEAGQRYIVHSSNSKINNLLLWNWEDDNRDLCYLLYGYFDSIGLISDTARKHYAAYERCDCYQSKMAEPDENLLCCMELLEDMGYLVRYKIRPKQDTPWFAFCEVGAYGTVAILNYFFKQDASVMEQLRRILKIVEKEDVK